MFLYNDEDEFDRPLPNGWGASLFEFDPEPGNGALHPHIILLSDQHHICEEGEILRGELEVILTAMRNRAIQTKNDEDDYDSDDTFIESGEGELQFPEERRFPVYITSFHIITNLTKS